MKITFAHLGDYATVSREGKLSVLGIFANINLPKLPAQHPQMFLAFELEMGYAEAGRGIPLEIHCVDADGNKLFELKGEMQADLPPGVKAKPGERRRIGQIMAIHNLKLTCIGAHEINIFVGGQLATTVPFTVTRIQSAEQPELPLPQ